MPNRICSTSLNEDAKNQSHFESFFYPLSMHKRKLRLLSTFVGGLARSFFKNEEILYYLLTFSHKTACRARIRHSSRL